MSDREIAISLLRLLAKQGFLCKEAKKRLVAKGFLSEKCNVTASGKRFVFEYFC